MQEQHYTWVADFTVSGRLAYLSHQETLTLFERALVRAGMPLVFSSGFNPRPHLSIPLPRNVGLASEAERLCAELSYPSTPDAEQVRRDVSEQLPEGCQLVGSSIAAGKITYYPIAYRLRFSLSEPVETTLREHIQNSIADLQARHPVVIERYVAKKDTVKPLDIALWLEQVDFENNNTINVRCRVSPEGTVRVDELMQWLRLRPEHLAEPAKRIEIHWNTNAA